MAKQGDIALPASGITLRAMD